MRFVDQLRTVLRRARTFFSNRDANIAMMFGLSLIPVTIAAGAGLDLTRAMIVKTNLSEALDAAALAAGSNPALSQSAMTTLAQNYFNANYKADAAYGTPAAVTLTFGTQSVTASSSVPMPTTLMNVAGIHTVNVTSSSTVVWGQTKLWVGLVLDNTGSMCQSDANPNAGSPCSSPDPGSKIVAEKAATHSLLGILQGAALNDGDVKVALIPFVKDVALDPGTYGNSAWIDFTAWDAANGTCSVSSNHSQSSCVAVTGSWAAPYCSIPSKTTQSTCQNGHGTWTAAFCSSSQYTTQSSCTSHNHTWTAASCDISSKTTQSSCTGASGVWTAGVCTIGGTNAPSYTTQSSCQAATATWTPSSHTTVWNGCITDRGNTSGPDTTNNYDAMNTAPSTASGSDPSKFVAEQYSNCPQSIDPLSSNWTTLSTDVDAMVAGGSTNQPIGLVWGWHALTNTDPLNSGTLPANTSRYIIILSDGLNTQDRWYGNGVNQSTSVDSRMSAVCTNAKADHIVVYAIFVDIGGTQGNSTVLQNCATDSTKYWDLTSTSQIAGVFTAIGQQITNLRVSQ